MKQATFSTTNTDFLSNNFFCGLKGNTGKTAVAYSEATVFQAAHISLRFAWKVFCDFLIDTPSALHVSDTLLKAQSDEGKHWGEQSSCVYRAKGSAAWQP